MNKEDFMSGDGIVFTDEMYARIKDEYTAEADFNEKIGIVLSVGRIMQHFGRFMKFVTPDEAAALAIETNEPQDDFCSSWKKANAQSIICERRIELFKEKLISILNT